VCKINPKTIIGPVPKVNWGNNMDRELDTWVDEVMDKQQYRNGIFSSNGILNWFRKLTFGSQ